MDPILTAISAYRDGWKAFEATPDDEADQHKHLWLRPHAVLSSWEGGCQTLEGALAALELAVEEEDIGDSALTAPLMKAALTFMRGNLEVAA